MLKMLPSLAIGDGDFRHNLVTNESLLPRYL